MAPYTPVLAAALVASSAFAAVLPGGGGISRPIPVSQSFQKFFNSSDLTGLVKADRQRVNAILSGSLAGSGGLQASFSNAIEAQAIGSAHATNQAIYYLTTVSVGNPATSYSLIIDTGSANTWVGSKTAYRTSNTSVSTGQRFAVNYQSSSVSGNLYTDKVALSSTLTVAAQQIGVATKSTGFTGVDGVLGLGPVSLTTGTTSLGTTVKVPTFTDNLYSKGVITNNVVSLSFAPTTAVGAVNGEITFGGVDTTQYTGALTYAPLTAKYPASAYWGVDAAVTYGSTVFLYGHPTIVESGLTLIYLATDAFKKYQAATGAVLDSATGMLKITGAQYNALQPLNLTIAGQKYSLNANAQIWPRTLNTAIGGSATSVYLVVADLGTPSGSGLDVIAGQVFMERFYTSFDSTNKKVGFANTKYTAAAIN